MHFRVGVVGDNSGKGGLACAGRAVEDEAGDGSCVEHSRQEFSFAYDVLLAAEIFKIFRSHSIRKRSVSIETGLLGFCE